MGLRELLGFGPSVNYVEKLEAGAWVIDVRTPEEFKQGHFTPSTNIPLKDLNAHVQKIIDSNKEVILVCRSGVRAGQAKGFLKRAGVVAHNGGGWVDFKSKVEKK